MEINSSFQNKIIIIGAGPAGLFAAYKLVELFGSGSNVLIIDKGKTIEKRHCSVSHTQCKNCYECALISGEGGAGLFSDGKLVFDLYSGGHLEKLISRNEKQYLEGEIGKIIDKFNINYIFKKPNATEDLISCFEKNNLQFNPYPVVHLGSKNLKLFTNDFVSYLKQHDVEFLYDTRVTKIKHDTNSNSWKICITKNGYSNEIYSEFVIFAVGKEGNFQLSSMLERLGGASEDNDTYIGIRMEINNEAANRLHNIALDPKISLSYNNIKIKTHCFCKNGKILLLKYFGLPLVGGHSPNIEKDKEFNPDIYSTSNIAILYRDEKVCTRERSLEIMKKINRLTNGQLLVQRLDDYINNKPTDSIGLQRNSIQSSISNVMPGNISDEILPGFRNHFILFLDRLSSDIPGINHPDNLLYAPAIEWWMKKFFVNKNMDVQNIPNVYAIGDGSGWTQGIIQSAATGILAAKNIFEKCNNKKKKQI